MSDLLKEAIADAKTVRETAIANAKMALEEAFTPHLKSMLSAKLAEDDMEDDEDEKENPFDGEERYGDEEEGEEREEGMHGDEEEGMHGDEEEGMHDNDEGEHEDEEEGDMREDNIIEIDGVKYAPVVAEEEDEEDKEERYNEGDDQELDLESVIKELETEIKEGEHEDDEDEKKVDEDIVTEEDDEDEDKDKTDEQSTSSGIGKGTGVKMASPGDEEDPDKAKEMKNVKTVYAEELNGLKAELKEHKEAVTFLREKLHEVNILNAKLLYTNRLFKEFVLSNDQKMKIVETFDRAQTTREIKLVYTTLAESFKGGSNVKKNRVQESASIKSGTTKPSKKIITEESQVADRFKKLAGII